MTPWSLRQKILAWVLAVTVLSLTVFSCGVALHLYFDGLRLVDRGMKKFSSRVFHSFSDRRLTPDEVTGMEKLAAHSPVRMWVRITSEDGGLLHESPEFPDLSGLPWRSGDIRSVAIGSSGFRVQDENMGGHRLRTVASLAAVNETWEDLLASYAIALPVSLLVLGAGCWLLSRKALRELSSIVETAEEITAHNLSARLPTHASDDEIAKLSGVMNSMFQRLENSFEQARRFTSDASHQLKTPLTILRGEIETMLLNPPVGEDDLLRLLEEVKVLSDMVDRLLFLSRAEAAQIRMEWENVDIGSVLEELAADFSDLALSRGFAWRCDIAVGLEVRGDRTLLGQLFVNLLENALKYNVPGGEISLSASSEKSEALVLIGNTGPQIAFEDREKIFDRFHRTNEESPSAPGHGLGLNIAREIARLHGGKIILASSGSGKTCFEARLPLLEK